MDKNGSQQFAERLRQAMLAAGYSPRASVLEREFNTRHWGQPMTLHGVARWLRGETMPSRDKIKTLADRLSVTPQELDGSDELAHRVKQRRSYWDSGIGYEEQELFKAFLKLPVPQRKVIREVILAFVRSQGEPR